MLSFGVRGVRAEAGGRLCASLLLGGSEATGTRLCDFARRGEAKRPLRPKISLFVKPTVLHHSIAFDSSIVGRREGAPNPDGPPVDGAFVGVGVVRFTRWLDRCELGSR